MTHEKGWHLRSENRTFIPLSGEHHPCWNGTKASVAAGRRRAIRRFRNLGNCERCKKAKAVDRHHKDNDTHNNERSNLMFVCRRCHMILDGRIDKLTKAAAQHATKSKTPPVPCIICKRKSKPIRHKRCSACAAFLKRKGRALITKAHLESKTLKAT